VLRGKPVFAAPAKERIRAQREQQQAGRPAPLKREEPHG
jgi:hypothetical protein